MSVHPIISLVFLFALGKLHTGYATSAYKWVPWEAANVFPENASVLDSSPLARYIGRTMHFDEILPAEIYANGSAYISSCQTIIPKEKLEILTISTKCEWRSYSEYEKIDNSAVRVGTAWNSEPIYLGKAASTDGRNNHVSSIYLTRGTTSMWYSDNSYNYNSVKQYLSCKTREKWIDTLAKNLPNNTVSGGKSDQNYDIYVARLKKDCTVVVGQAIPDENKATAALNDGRAVESPYCQVLVEAGPNEYEWVSTSDGEIPDYAIAEGKRGREQSYIARINMTIRHLAYSEAINYKRMNYEILVNNKF